MIYRSLSALGDVVQALATRSRHVPYRNSKLTHLLQDALNDNSYVMMIVNINGEMESVSESSHSLQFANRCRYIYIYNIIFYT
jgi:kinesin family protein C2/C3